jgi:hypothetical protein
MDCRAALAMTEGGWIAASLAMTGIYCVRNDGALIRHREAKGRGDPSLMKRTHGLPRFARNDGG